MFWLLLLLCLVSGFSLAKNPYYIAVCGISRNTEELELVLELTEGVLVKKCRDKKLDASIRLTNTHIEASGTQKIILQQKREGSVVTERKAQQFIAALIQRLEVKEVKAEKPRVTEPKIEAVKVEIPAIRHSEEIKPTTESKDPGLLRDAHNDENTWQIESLASIDQWNYQVSTTAYPGAQLAARIRIPDNWEIGTKAAFGTSAFQVGDQIAWNQQVFFALSGGKIFELGYGLSVMPKVGYLYWGSFSALNELPNFQRHDAKLGAELIYTFVEPSIEIRLLLSGLPVNLGMQSFLAMRYHFMPAWFAVLQGGIVASWGHETPSTFLSASLGLGLTL